MSETASFRRNPLVISGNNLSSGDRSTTFSSTSPTSLLRSYLIFVRDMRGQRREPSIELRSEDVAVIAAHLGVSEEYVLGGLLDLMGATRAQRNTMMAMLAAGALTLVLTGSFVSDLSSDGVSVEMSRLAEAVHAAAARSDSAPDSGTPTETGGVAAAAVADPASARVGSTPADGPAASEAAASDAAITENTAAENAATENTAAENADAVAPAASSGVVRDVPISDVVRSAAANVIRSQDGADASAASESVGQVAQEPVSIGVTSDGSVVASVAPPVPATSDEQVATAELPDGTTVGVAAPPVPPPPADEQVATAELPDGTTVGVAAPPVPPPPTEG